MRFSFIHAADLHIDSPLDSLGAKDPAVAERFARAGRAAVEALVAETIASDAKFLIVAGDIFDGDWRDVSTGLFFARQLGKLHLEGIPTFIAKGNHDAESVMSRALPYPDSVHVFSAARAETRLIEALGVALHGRSFAQRGAADDFVTTYPARREGWLNIGVLHTGLDGARGHYPYAPCTVGDLSRYGYDYWALGHIHAGEIVSRDPWVVYPGNLQGRSPRETGPKGAMRVSVEDGRVVGVDPIALDAARWAHETIDVSGLADASEAPARVGAALERAYRSAEGRPLAARVTLTGVTPAHARLVAHREQWEADARALGFAIGADCWLERLKIDTSPPTERAAAVEPDSLDVDALIGEAAGDSEFAATLAELTRAVSEKLPAALRPEMKVDDPAALAKLVALTREFLRGERQ
jgi:DNA repair exonuclease SbcCD nuclease subunit